MKRFFTILSLIVLLSGCHRHSEGGQFNIREFPVKEGIDVENENPMQMTFFSYSDGIVATMTYPPPNNTVFYRTGDEGITWTKQSLISKWYCESLIISNGCIYAAMRFSDDIRLRSKIIMSQDTAKTWQELASFEDDYEIKNIGVRGRDTIAILRYHFVPVDIKKEGFRSPRYGRDYEILVSNDRGKYWNVVPVDTTVSLEEASFAFSEGLVTTVERKTAFTQIDIASMKKDSLTVDKPPIDVGGWPEMCRSGEIIGISENDLACFYSVHGHNATYESTICANRHSPNDPIWLYQYGDMVYTSVNVCWDKVSQRTYISYDRAKTWHPVCNEWFMTGYKDRLYNFKIINENGSRKAYMMVLEPTRKKDINNTNKQY